MLHASPGGADLAVGPDFTVGVSRVSDGPVTAALANRPGQKARAEKNRFA